MLNRSLILIGMPGCGKSTVGKVLAKKLGCSFLDTDTLIKKKTNESLQETLDKHGKKYFTDIEREVLLELNPSEPLVIATGGSVILYPDAMMHLGEIGMIIFLDADLPLIRQRLWNVDTRGIIFSDNVNSESQEDSAIELLESDSSMTDKDELFDLYREREPLYFKYMDIRVHVRSKSVNQIVTEIIQGVERE